MAIERKKKLNPYGARILAVVFLLAGITLGALETPSYFISLLDKAGIPSAKFQILNSKFPYRLGLDIQGGTHLVYQADLSQIESSDYSDAMESVRDVIERRVNLFGVSEPLVQVERSGRDSRLIVELAGIKDINTAIRLIGETPYLEFKEERPQEESQAIQEAQKNKELLFEDPYFVSTSLTGRHVKRAEIYFDPNTSQPIVGLKLTDEGSKIFAELTKKNLGKRLAIYLDGLPISAPTVQSEITGGEAQITGNFTPESAKLLAGRLNAGALPVPITLIAQQTVEAALGQESLTKSLQAGLWGLIAVMIFMIFWYRFPGLLSVFALLFYAVIVVAIFKLVPVTLTVAGIVGFVLSIGMAVDANILIFERMKEELLGGRTLEDSIQQGFRRAWTSIRDSNISSLITAGILYWLGTSVVKGFALVLGIGILVSMFSAIVVTKMLLTAFMNRRMQNWKSMFLSGIKLKI